VFPLLAAAGLIAAIGCGGWGVYEFYDRTIVTARNFYGVLRCRSSAATNPGSGAP
jgi:hypothetical protein